MALNMSSLFLSFLPQIFVVCSQIEPAMKMWKKETKEKKKKMWICVINGSYFLHLIILIILQRVLGDGLLVVRKIENVATGPNNRPKLPCIIAECGEM